jgi:hypothetical protein
MVIITTTSTNRNPLPREAKCAKFKLKMREHYFSGRVQLNGIQIRQQEN